MIVASTILAAQGVRPTKPNTPGGRPRAPVEEQVAHERGVLVRLVGAQQQERVEPEHARDGGRGAAVVALDASARDDAVGALRHGLGHEELELADLVARRLHAAKVLRALAS